MGILLVNRKNFTTVSPMKNYDKYVKLQTQYRRHIIFICLNKYYQEEKKIFICLIFVMDEK